MESPEQKKELKEMLLQACMALQQKALTATKGAMLQAQESANETANTMGDKFESFREQCQIDRDMYAKQYEEALGVMKILERLDPAKLLDSATFGSVVYTDAINIFVSVSLGQIKIGEKTFVAVSTKSPIYQAIMSKKKGDTFRFRDKEVVINEVF